MHGMRRALISKLCSLNRLGSEIQSKRCVHCDRHVFDAGQPTHASHPQLLRQGEITPGITENEYISRRKRLLEMLPERSLVILASGHVKMMTDVVPYPFRQDADYFYITGCQQPGGVSVLSKDFGLCMFMPDPSPQIVFNPTDGFKLLGSLPSFRRVFFSGKEVIWQGQVAGVDAALDVFKAERALAIGKMHEVSFYAGSNNYSVFLPLLNDNLTLKELGIPRCGVTTDEHHHLILG